MYCSDLKNNTKWPHCFVIVILIVFLLSGCATHVLERARKAYYSGRSDDAIKILNNARVANRDRVLFLMERGTAYQAAGKYKDSVRDFNDVHELLEQSETKSVSRGAASMLINDNALMFRGYPMERTYLHVMAALSYLADGNRADAAVEARRIINTLKPDELGDYPEDAFSRYLAGVCLELVDDMSSPRVQYRKASELSMDLTITDHGIILPKSDKEGKIIDHRNNINKGESELICFILLGRVADYSAAMPAGRNVYKPFTEIQYNGRTLGMAYTLTDVRMLASVSEEKLAAAKAARAAARIAAKGTIAYQIQRQNPALGFLTWFILSALEQPDYRHWETLPHYMQAARISCPSDIDHLDLIIHGHSGKRPHKVRISKPVNKKDTLFITFVREF